MEEFLEKDEKIISEMQQVILEKTSDLSEKTRSKVYSNLQSLKYYYISFEEANYLFGGLYNAAAFYVHKEHRVYIIKKEEKTDIRPEVILHEMIHATTKIDKTAESRFMQELGISRYLLARRPGGQYIVAHNMNSGLNEGLTEFFARDFLNNSKSVAYHDFVNIVSILCTDCGYDNLKEVYFNSDIDGMRNLLKTTYHLTDDYLVDKLLTQLDTVFNYNYEQPNRKAVYGQNAIFAEPYKTLVKMKITKELFEHRNEIKQQEDVFKFFDIKKYLTSGMQFDNKRKETDIIFADFEKNKLSLLNDRFDRDGFKHSIGFILYMIERTNLGTLNYTYFNTLKTQQKRELLKAITTLNAVSKISNGINRVNVAHTLKTWLKNIHDANGKINLDGYSKEEKHEFITNVVYSTYVLDPNGYTHFYPKDLVEYVLTGETETEAFCQKDAMNYIFDELTKSCNTKNLSGFFGIAYNRVKLDRILNKGKDGEEIELKPL